MAAINPERCRARGRVLKEGALPDARELDGSGGLPSPDLRMCYFLVVAICHQTSPPGKERLEGMQNGVLRFGWDYLRLAWFSAAKADPSILTPSWLMRCQASDIIYILHDHERHVPAHISDPEGRAHLLRDIGVVMRRDRVEHVDAYYRASGGWIRNTDLGEEEPAGLERLFSRFEAYGRDPVKKKLTCFLLLMHRYGFWQYRDIEYLGALLSGAVQKRQSAVSGKTKRAGGGN